MVIQIDTREKQKAIQKIIQTFDCLDIRYISSKLYVGDYMIYGHPEVIVDRKQNLSELASNLSTEHKRFKNELMNAKEVGSKIIVLIEDDNYSCLEDVKKWSSKHTKLTGEWLYKTMTTMQNKKDEYDVEFRFCKKTDTGEEIVKILLESTLNKGW